MVTDVVPELVTVSVCGWLPDPMLTPGKLSEGTLTETLPPPVVPPVAVPLKKTDAATPDCPLIVTVRLPLDDPGEVGEKVTDAVPLPPFAASGSVVGDTEN